MEDEEDLEKERERRVNLNNINYPQGKYDLNFFD